MFHVDILQSEKDQKFYIGATSDLTMRLVWHNEGKNKSTTYRRPFHLMYSEQYQTKKETLARERQIKDYKGGEAFKKLLHGGFA